MRIEDVASFEILEKRQIDDIRSEGVILRHKKTGAKVVLLSNDDENKVFYIGFRTPPRNSTGVAHILEHSVLCGSKEFPMKDPFVELAKGSLNTFLNAMTYPDKTLYPVASCNDADFRNLMHVYLDAVFYANIYTNESIFRQEGWHYEIEKPEDDLVINGVVYNEMKGALSAPEDLLEQQLLLGLYPDSIYGNESGGDPEFIPDLSYEEFLAFHSKFYHPSNSYIYLYGNMDMAEKLIYLDEAYLSNFDALSVDSEIGIQPAFDAMRRIEKPYPVNSGETEEENTHFGISYSVADSLDREMYVAMQVIDYALCSAPGAVLHEALIEKGLGKDVYSICENGIKQPFFAIVSKDADASREAEFLQVVEETLKKVVSEGFDEKALLAGLNNMEFKFREADFGTYPKGLMYGLQIMDSWLYDESKPFIHIEALETFAKLRSKIKEGYFEKLIEKYLLNNSHSILVVLKPKAGLMEEQEEKALAKLAEIKANMTPEDIEEAIRKYEALNAFRETPDSKEDLEKLPLLRREDLKKEPVLPVNKAGSLGDIPFLHHDIFTNGIAYLRLQFSLKDIPEEYYKYMGIFKECMGLMNTANYRYGDLANEVNLVSGGIGVHHEIYNLVDGSYKTFLEVTTKTMFDNIDKTMELVNEILFSSDYADEKRLYELLAEERSRMQTAMMGAGHRIASARALSYGSEAAVVEDNVNGINFYRLLCDLVDNFEEKKGDLIEKLQTLAHMILRKENLSVDLTAGEETIAMIEAPVQAVCEKLYTDEVKKGEYHPAVEVKNEGFMTSGQVQYVCRAGSFTDKGLPFKGTLRVLRVMMGYEYLWTNIRVKGGAYGCMCNFTRTGQSYFVSYRDPNLAKTVDTFEKAGEFIANYEADERTMTKYVIGAVSLMDTPFTPVSLGSYSRSAYLTGVTDEMIVNERLEVLNATAEDIRALSAYIDAFIGDEHLCVVGNAAKIKEEEKIFGNIENLF